MFHQEPTPFSLNKILIFTLVFELERTQYLAAKVPTIGS